MPFREDPQEKIDQQIRSLIAQHKQQLPKDQASGSEQLTAEATGRLKGLPPEPAPVTGLNITRGVRRAQMNAGQKPTFPQVPPGNYGGGSVAVPPTLSKPVAEDIIKKSVEPKAPTTDIGLTEEEAKRRGLTGKEAYDFIRSEQLKVTGQKTTATEQAKQATAPTLSKGGIDIAAQEYLLTGTLPFGFANPQMRAAVVNRAAELAMQAGETPASAATIRVRAQAVRAELTKVRTIRGTVGPFEQTANKNLDVVGSLMNKPHRTGVPLLNAWINSGRRQITGDPDITRLDVAIRTAVNEYARVTTTATAGGVTSDQARKEVESLLYSAQTPEQMDGAIQVFRIDMGNRISSLDEATRTHEDELNRLLPGGGPGGTVPRGNAGQVSPTGTGQVHDQLPDPAQFNGKTFRDTQTGKRYKSDGSRWVEVP